MERVHAALQHMQRLGAHRLGRVFPIEHGGNGLQYSDAAAQIMGRLAPSAGASLPESRESLQTPFKLCDLCRRFRLPHLGELACALADAVIDEAHQRAPSDRHGGACIGAETAFKKLKFGKQTQMQMTPVTRGFTRIVALLPALQSVGGRSLFLILGCLVLLLWIVFRVEAPLECICLLYTSRCV